MQWLAELCVRRPVMATVFSLIIMVFGSAAYTQLGLDQFPKVDLPIALVVTTLPGASPEDIETEISDKIEGAVNTISGIEELRSVSSEGVSQVIIQFNLEKPLDTAVQEVRDKVSSILTDLPRGIDPPVINKLDPDAQPVLYLALQAPQKTTREITELADLSVRRRLESINGVGEVTILGGQKRQVNIWVDPLKLKGLGLTASDVSRAIGAQNLTLPGGRVDTSHDFLTMRVHGRVASVEGINDIVVREAGGRQIHVSDVARVEDGTEEQATAAQWNGARTVVLAVRKQSGTNTVEVVDHVLERVKELQKALPAGYSMEVQRDASGAIRTSADAVKEHLVVGALFAALIVLVFLGNLRSTVIAAVAIPTSIIGTFALMYLRGYTLNSITLLALALAVGIVIDDAIVVLENIFKYIDEKGYQPREAAVAGTKEIGPAVLATTLSLIAVFLPIAFIAGIPGRFLGSFGITMAFAIVVSLFVSFSLTPMLASRWLKAKKPGEHKKNPLEKLVDIFYRPLERIYMVILGFCMAHRWVVVLLCIGAMATLKPLAQHARKGFIPIDDKAQFQASVRLPEGRSLASTELIGARVAREIRALPNVTATLLTIGSDAQKTPNLASIYVKLTDPTLRKESQDEMKDIVRKQILSKLDPELRTLVSDVDEFGGGQSTARVQYVMSGPDLAVLESATAHILAKLHQMPTAVDIDSTLILGKPELGVFIDRQRASDLGVEVQDIAQALSLLVGGAKISNYEESGEEYDVRLRADSQFRDETEALRQLTVPSRKVGMISLFDVVTVKPGTGPATINRYQRERQITIMVNGTPGSDESQLGNAIQQAFDDEHLPAAFRLNGAGQTKEMKKTGISFVLGLLAAMVFMYLILAAQFESWLHPVTILVSLPLTLPFAIASIVMTGSAIDMFSLLGIFVLFGVVKKNAILQIDHTNHLRGEGMERLAAIMQANKDRLRPILMTTLAFVAGMAPLVFSKGIGSGFNRATAGVVVGGQVMSLLLTLVAVPVVYSFFDDVSQWVWRTWARFFPSDETPKAAPAIHDDAVPVK